MKNIDPLQGDDIAVIMFRELETRFPSDAGIQKMRQNVDLGEFLELFAKRVRAITMVIPDPATLDDPENWSEKGGFKKLGDLSDYDVVRNAAVRFQEQAETLGLDIPNARTVREQWWDARNSSTRGGAKPLFDKSVQFVRAECLELRELLTRTYLNGHSESKAVEVPAKPEIPTVTEAPASAPTPVHKNDETSDTKNIDALVTALVAREDVAATLLGKSPEVSRQSDVDWMMTIIDLHRKELEGAASKYFWSNPEMQDEVVQDSIVSAIRYVAEHGRIAIDEEKIIQWIAAIVRNKCFDIFRAKKKQRQVSLHQVGADGEPVIIEIEASSDIEDHDFVLPEEFHKKSLEAFYKYLEELDLGEPFRQLFAQASRRGRLWFILLWGGFSHDRIASEFDVTVNAVNVAIYKFRTWMKENAREFLKEDELEGLISSNRGNSWPKKRPTNS